MTGRTRVLALIVTLLAVYAAGQYGMNYWTSWDAATKASVWVAVGTLLLAVATAWSVWETRLVIRGEDRRHQQSFVPIVNILPGLYCDSETHRFFIKVVNYGKGPAFKVRATVKGSCSITWRRTRIPAPLLGARATDLVEDEAQDYPIDDDFFVTIVPDRAIEATDALSDSVITPLAEGAAHGFPPRGPSITKYQLTEVNVEYADLFGNSYSLKYTDFQKARYSLETPTELKPPQA